MSGFSKMGGGKCGHMECHIENDFLLIWLDLDSDEISLVRLGSHSELFGQSLEYIRRIDFGRGMVKDGTSS